MAGAFVSPAGSKFDDPVEQGTLKTDIAAGFFAFDPLVTQDFLPLGKILLVERGIFDEVEDGLGFGRTHLRMGGAAGGRQGGSRWFIFVKFDGCGGSLAISQPGLDFKCYASKRCAGCTARVELRDGPARVSTLTNRDLDRNLTK